jgi:hypothetical protein
MSFFLKKNNLLMKNLKNQLISIVKKLIKNK